MSQPKLEYLLIEVAQLIGDTVSTAGADGNIFTSADRLDSINSARKLLYNQLLEKFGVDDFIMMFPEFTKNSGSIAKTGGTLKGVYIQLNAANFYTESTKRITVGAGLWSVGITNFTAGADFLGALAMIGDMVSETPPARPIILVTNITKVISASVIEIAKGYGADIPASELSGMISVINAGYYAKPSGARKVLEAVDGGGVYAKEMKSRLRLNSQNSDNSQYKGTANFPKYFEHDKGIEITPDGYSTAQFNLLMEPLPAVLGGSEPDIIEPVILLEEIKHIAALILLDEQQE